MSEDTVEASQYEQLRALVQYLEYATYRTVETLALSDTQELTRTELHERLEAIRQMFLWRNEARTIVERYLSGYLSLVAALDALGSMRDDFDRIARPVLETPPGEVGGA
jgi:hypothetical protein